MDRRKFGFVLLAFVVILILMVGCAREQERPAPGDPGDQEELDINTLVSQWVDSNHSNILLAPAQREGCVVCHDGGAFSEQIVDPAEIDRDFFVSIDCRACHVGYGVELMESGTVNIPTQENVQAGLGAQCLSCHNERRVPNIEDANRSGPHYSSQAGVFTATGGIRREGFNYGSSAAHVGVEDTCVGCHMLQTEEGFASHTFQVDDVEAACAQCHANINTFNLQARNDYDGDGETSGFQDEVQGLLDRVQEAIAEALEGGSFEAAGGRIIFKNTVGEEIQVPDEVYLAAYNHRLVSLDGSLGIHNPRFAVQLLQQSYHAVTGEPVPDAHIWE
jgi:hypothetical protein